MNNPDESPRTNRLSKMIRESRYRKLKRCKVLVVVLIAVSFFAMIITSQPEHQQSSKDKKSHHQKEKISPLDERKNLQNAAKNYINSKSKSVRLKSNSVDSGSKLSPKLKQKSFHQSSKLNSNFYKFESKMNDTSNQRKKIQIMQQLSKKKLDTFKLPFKQSLPKKKPNNTFALNKNDVYSQAFGNKLKKNPSNVIDRQLSNKTSNGLKSKDVHHRHQGHKGLVIVPSKNATSKGAIKNSKLNSSLSRNKTEIARKKTKVKALSKLRHGHKTGKLSHLKGKVKYQDLKKKNRTWHLHTKLPINAKKVAKIQKGKKIFIKAKEKIPDSDDSFDDTLGYEDELDPYQEEDPYAEISENGKEKSKPNQSKTVKTSKNKSIISGGREYDKNTLGSIELDEIDSDDDEDSPLDEEEERLNDEQESFPKSKISKSSNKALTEKNAKGKMNLKLGKYKAKKKNRYSMDRQTVNTGDKNRQNLIDTDEEEFDSMDTSNIQNLPSKKNLKFRIKTKKTSNVTKLRSLGNSTIRLRANQSVRMHKKQKMSRLSSLQERKLGIKKSINKVHSDLSRRQHLSRKSGKKALMPSVVKHKKQNYELDPMEGETWPLQMLRQPKSISSPLERQIINRLPRTKTILIWSQHPNRHQSEAGIDLSCGQHHCRVVRDPSQYTKSAAVIFQNYRKEFSSFQYFPEMKLRPEQQLWIYHNRRSPVYNQQAHIKILRFHLAMFNLVMSHTHDADLIHHYGSITKGNFQQQFDPQRNYAQEKTKLMAYYSARCNHQTKTFLNNLREFIPIDAYGPCGNITCPNGTQHCMEMIARKYKFLLIMEDSICRDYATQELYTRGLKYDIVPVVVGGANYEDPRTAPPYSLINVFNFASSYQLAKYLKQLDNDDTLYNHYFMWRLHYKVDKGNDISDLCGLCNNLYDDKWVADKRKSTHYDLWKKWGDAERNCLFYPTELNGQTKQQIDNIYAISEEHHGKFTLT